MKLRHVRAIAILGIAVVALTGARGSHGGGCSSGSSSSSSSSSGGGSSSTGGSGHDSDDSGLSSTGGTTGSGSSSGSGSGGSGNRDKAMDDLRIESCRYDEAVGLQARVRATNSSTSRSYDYKFTVEFTDSSGKEIAARTPSIPLVQPSSSETVDVATPYVLKDGETATGFECRVTQVTRTSA